MFDNEDYNGTSYFQLFFLYLINHIFAQSAGAVEYTDCTSAEGYDPP